MSYSTIFVQLYNIKKEDLVNLDICKNIYEELCVFDKIIASKKDFSYKDYREKRKTAIRDFVASDKQNQLANRTFTLNQSAAIFSTNYKLTFLNSCRDKKNRFIKTLEKTKQKNYLLLRPTINNEHQLFYLGQNPLFTLFLIDGYHSFTLKELLQLTRLKVNPNIERQKLLGFLKKNILIYDVLHC